MEPNFPTSTLTPAAVAQLVGVRAAQLVAQGVPELAGLIHVVGRLSSLGEARGTWYYAVRLSDDAGAVLLDIPLGLAKTAHLESGQYVRATGALRVQAARPGFLEFRIAVSQIFPVEDPADTSMAWPTATPARMTIDRMNALKLRKASFPDTRPIRVSLIRSSSPQARVAEDCLAELQRVRDALVIEQLRVNILDARQIAEAISRAAGDVVMLIRGGGDGADFDVFDDPRVVEAMAAKRAYRVVGLGHSGNSTLLDHIVEHAARTPAQAGMHVRERLEAIAAPSQVLAPASVREAHGFWRLVDSVPGWGWALIVVAATAAIVHLILR